MEVYKAIANNICRRQAKKTHGTLEGEWRVDKGT